MRVARARALLCVTLLARVVFPPTASPTQSAAGGHGGDSIDGTVVLEIEKRPAPGVVVAAKSLPDGPSQAVLTDDDGWFHFRDLSPGIYDVFAEESGGYASSHAITQLGKSSQALRLSLTSPSPLRVPLAGIGISVHQLSIPSRARTEFDEGLRLLRQQQLPESITHFRDAIRRFPDFYEAYHGIGLANLNLARYQEATEALQKAIELSAGNYLLSEFALGVVYWREKNLPEAELALLDALQHDPSYPSGHLYLSAVLYDQDRLQEAEKSARAAILRDPSLATAYLILARVYDKRGKTEEQLRCLEKYLSLGADDTQHSVRNLYDAVKSRRISAESIPPR